MAAETGEKCALKIVAGDGKDGGDVVLNAGDEALCIPLDIVVEKMRRGLQAVNSGDCVISSGMPLPGGKAGSLIFIVGRTEVLRIDPEGVFRAGDRVLGKDFEVGTIFRAFLGHAAVAMNRPDPNVERAITHLERIASAEEYPTPDEIREVIHILCGREGGST